MGRTAELRRKLNETQKAGIQNGLNSEVKNTFKQGNYAIYHLGSLSVQELTEEQAWDFYNKGANLTKVNDEVVHALETISKVSKEKLAQFKELLKDKEAKASSEKENGDLKLSSEAKASLKSTSTSIRAEAGAKSEAVYKLAEDAELKAAVEAMARVGASLAGVYAEVGAKAEVGLSIKGKHVEFEDKFYAEVKASAQAGIFGASAQASAEAAAEGKLGVNVKKIVTATGTEVTIQLYFAIKAFAKAEAYAGVGIATKTGAEAFAGVGIEGKIGADVYRKKTSDKDRVNAGGAYVALTFKAGAAIGGSAGFNVMEVRDNNQNYMEFKVSASFAFLLGGEMEIGGKVLEDVFNEAKDELIQKLKNSIGDEVIKKIEEEIANVKEELEYHIKEAARKVKKGWENTANFGKKLLIAIEDGMGSHKQAMEDEIKRQIGKLEQYKRELNGVISKFEELGMDDSIIDKIIDEVSDSKFASKINAFFGGGKIEHKALKKELMLDLERYDRRIEKMNEFLDKSYTETLRKVDSNIKDLAFLIGDFTSKDIPDNFKDSKDFKLMVSKIGQIQGMVSSIESIVEQKKRLLKEVKDQTSLSSLINEMGKQHNQIRKDFAKLYTILSDYVDRLPSTK